MSHETRGAVTSALDVVGGQRHIPAALPEGNSSAIQGRGGWFGPRAGLDGYGEISFPLPNFELRPVKHVACRYTD
jgi:hypothetical protein